MKIKLNDLRNRRVVCIVAIIICLPLSLMCAASQGTITTAIFGFVLALSINELIESFNNRNKQER